MEILRTAEELKQYRAHIQSLQLENFMRNKNEFENSKASKEVQPLVAFESVGLVPTMGALHNGHKSLIVESKKRDFYTIVSIFVNPTQFGANEDFASYPRTLDSDLQVCKGAGVSAVFVPSAEVLYADMAQNATQSGLDEVGFLPPKSMGYVLEGFDRPTHFSGVLQVVLKLFNLARPTRAYFGKKDAQQVLIIQKMVRDFFLPLEIVPCSIVRDFDGLALSSRNVYLSQSEREIALCIPRTIELLQEKIAQGMHDISTLESLARENLKATHIFYAKFFDRNLRRLESLQKDKSIFLLSARVGHTRLLDNFWY